MAALTRRAIMVVTAADQVAANVAAAMIDPDTGGDKTFGVPLSASGNNPATHYAADGHMTPATLAAVEDLHSKSFAGGAVYRSHTDRDHEPAITRYTFDEVLTELGLQRIEG